MELIITPATAHKLKYKHKVTEHEVLECFHNRTKETLVDDREKHRSTPPTEWFIASTSTGRRLKVVFIPILVDELAILRTAYSPNKQEEKLYEQET
jgi:uncharacterized DUF497 family protein